MLSAGARGFVGRSEIREGVDAAFRRVAFDTVAP